jgi:DNA-binding NtrC family response regulator
MLKQVSDNSYEVVLLDCRVAAETDIDLIHFTLRRHPGTEIIMLAEVDDIDKAAEAIRQGAYFYVLKSMKMDDVAMLGESALDAFQRANTEDLVGTGGAMRRVLELAAKVAPTNSTVLLTGETGTGKEVLANLIHQISPRRGRAFVAVNCAALPETLLESELFGYKKGAFTGATTDKKGLFEEAEKGTMFLDEVSEMTLMTQVKLLRVLQDGELRRVGDTLTRRVDVRVIAATNQDLRQRIEEKTFREDLYFRLNVIQIRLPPLRERMDALPSLVRHFIDKCDRKLNKRITGVDESAQLILENYDYPGNIRELENMIEHAAIMADSGLIRAVDLPEHVTVRGVRRALPERSEGDFLTLEEMEKRLIVDTLTRCNGNQTEAAKKLGISRSTLWRKVSKHAIRLSQFETSAED